MNKKRNKTIEELMKDDQPEEKEFKEELKIARGSSKKIWKILGILVVILILVGGGYVIWKSYIAKDNLKKDEQKIENKVEPEKKTETEKKTVFVNADGGLNQRKEASSTAEIITTIPNGTKLTVLEEKDGWYKVEYNGQTGWVSKEFTTNKDPLAYENTEYGFKMTFPNTWSGYKFYKKVDTDGSITLYVELPTKDANWKESSTNEAGYASLMAISVLTQAQWDAIKDSEGPKPTYIGQNDKYVFAWSSAQANATDLASQFKDIKTVMETFEVIK